MKNGASQKMVQSESTFWSQIPIWLNAEIKFALFNYLFVYLFAALAMLLGFPPVLLPGVS